MATSFSSYAQMQAKAVAANEPQCGERMAARRSLSRSMGKFDKDAKGMYAILTAYQGEGKWTDEENAHAFKVMSGNLKDRGLSWYPMTGYGQEDSPVSGELVQVREKNYVVSPIEEMTLEDFLANVKGLLYNPTGMDPDSVTAKAGNMRTQWGALVKLPGQVAILLNSPPDYVQTRAKPDNPEDKGLEDKASVSGPSDEFRTELRGGKGRGFVMRNRK